MQFTSTLLVLATVATSSIVSAKCYTSGQNWAWTENYEAARGAVKDLCKSNGLAGYFREGQEKSACANLPKANAKVDFGVKWTGKGGLTLRDADCEWRLTNEINGCGLGGETTTADWWFKSDPNNGRC
ncbi:hypothetical protein VTL71DRAFT_815 [Oculimacula yallundae]|uniref:Glycan binding protein Y3-like domain-containing protein n=1 Tax=Oculimacula yallundae TaxID=86028 RepID=A0ABR4D222_9HELO